MDKPGQMDVQEIMRYLPHRPPFLLVDRVVAIELGRSIVAIKNVTANEWFFAGHFPGQPVMPGVLVLEALAQAAAILGFKSLGSRPQEGGLYLFAGIDNTRFRRIVQVGDQLSLKVEILKLRKNLIKVLGTAMVGDELVCTTELLSVRREEGEPNHD